MEECSSVPYNNWHALLSIKGFCLRTNIYENTCVGDHTWCFSFTPPALPPPPRTQKFGLFCWLHLICTRFEFFSECVFVLLLPKWTKCKVLFGSFLQRKKTLQERIYKSDQTCRIFMTLPLWPKYSLTRECPGLIRQSLKFRKIAPCHWKNSVFQAPEFPLRLGS